MIDALSILNKQKHSVPFVLATHLNPNVLVQDPSGNWRLFTFLAVVNKSYNYYFGINPEQVLIGWCQAAELDSEVFRVRLATIPRDKLDRRAWYWSQPVPGQSKCRPRPLMTSYLNNSCSVLVRRHLYIWSDSCPSC